MDRSSEELTELAEEYVDRVRKISLWDPGRKRPHSEEAVRASREVLARLQGGTPVDTFLLQEYHSLREELSRRLQAQERISLTTLVGAAPLLVIGASSPVRIAFAALGVLIVLSGLASLLWQQERMAVLSLTEYLTLIQSRFSKEWGWERYITRGGGPDPTARRPILNANFIFAAIQLCAIIVAIVRFVTAALSIWNVGELIAGFAVGVDLVVYSYWIGARVQPRAESALLLSLGGGVSEPVEEPESEETSGRRAD